MNLEILYLVNKYNYSLSKFLLRAIRYKKVNNNEQSKKYERFRNPRLLQLIWNQTI